MEIKNLAPNSDTIIIKVGDVEIKIWRDTISDTFVEVYDEDGSEYHLVLGQESETHKL